MGAMQECIDTYGGLIWSLARRYLSTGSEAEEEKETDVQHA